MTRTGILAVAAALVMTLPAAGQQRARDIRFAPGKTSVELRGVIRGDRDAAFTVRAVDGQVMQVLFSPTNRSCYFNAYEPGAAEAAHIGSSSGNEFGRSPTKAGAYRLQVYLMRNAARRSETCRYRLSVELTGGPGGASAGISDRQMRDACLARAAPMYGVRTNRIRLAALKSGPDGPFIDGTANKGREGVKKLRCRFDAARRLTDVMAMTPDGE